MDPRFVFKTAFLFSFGGIDIDSTTNFSEIFSANQSSYAREDGAPITRGRFLNPVEISFEGRISDTPFGPLGTLLSGGSRLGRGKDKLDDLIKLFLSTETFTVGSGFHVFKGFQFTRLEATKQKPGFWFEFKASIKQMPSVSLPGSNSSGFTQEILTADAFGTATLLATAVMRYGTTSPTEFRDALGILK